LHIEIRRIGRQPENRSGCHAAFERELARDHLDGSAAGQIDARDLGGLDVAITRRLHLLLRRQVEPELEAAHAALLLLRHLGVNDSAACGHPLHRSAHQVPAVAEMILVQHVAVEQVGHGLEAAVRVRRKAGNVVVGVVRRKLVEHQERVDAQVLRTPEAAAKLHSGAVRCRNRLDDLLKLAGGHDGLLARVRVASPRIESTLHAPAPEKRKYRKTKLYSTASSP
jgi:hypothetical protein